jgi:hypothetical protein
VVSLSYRSGRRGLWSQGAETLLRSWPVRLSAVPQAGLQIAERHAAETGLTAGAGWMDCVYWPNDARVPPLALGWRRTRWPAGRTHCVFGGDGGRVPPSGRFVKKDPAKACEPLKRFPRPFAGPSCDWHGRLPTVTADTKHIVSELVGAPARMDNMADTSPTRPRQSSPVLFAALLAIIEAFLYASDRFGWFAFNQRSGWTAIVGVLVVAAWLLLFAMWMFVSRFFKRRLQFGLATILAVVFVVAFPLAWLASDLRQSKLEATLAAAIEAEGGTVDRPIFLNGPTMVDKMLISVFGIDFVLPVWQVKLSRANNLDRLRSFHSLQSIDLDYASLTDDDLESITGLPRLTDLSLSHTLLTDKGLETLATISQLQTLYMDGTEVTDIGLRRLAPLRELEILSVEETPVTDEGRQGIKELLPNAWVSGVDFH